MTTKSPRDITTIAVEAIHAGLTDSEVLQAIRDERPGNRTSLASINWYRNKTRRERPFTTAERNRTRNRK